MKKLLFSCFLLGCVLTASGQVKNFLDQPYLETSARADTLVVPDRIFLGVRITEEDTKGRVSVEELEQQMVRRLKSLGIDTEKDLAVLDLSSDFKKYFLRGQVVLKEKAFELMVPDADMAGRVLYELEKLGIANTYLSRTEYSAMEALQVHLKAVAVRKAMNTATAMTEALGQELGPAIYISDAAGFSPMAMAPRARPLSGAEAAKDEYIPIGSEFRKIRVEASVQVKFKLNEP